MNHNEFAGLPHEMIFLWCLTTNK